jgi:hypothetical protein
MSKPEHRRAWDRPGVTPAATREAVVHLRSAFEVSERRECLTIGLRG